MRVRALLGKSLASAVALVTVASCGSRTGLFANDTGVAFGEGGATALPDASFDAARDAPQEAAVPCVPGRFDLDLGFAQLVLVIDRSGSMEFGLTADAPPAAGQPTRWQALRTALGQALAPFDGEIAFGAKFFPEPFRVTLGTDGCFVDTGVAVPPKLGGVASILQAYDAYNPRGGTPTAEAVRAAAELIKQRRGVARTLVVATDGAPNCNDNLDPRTCICTSSPDQCGNNVDPSICLDDKSAIDTVRRIADEDRIPVYVLGIGGSSNTAFTRTLDGMAVAGGRPRGATPRYYPAQSPAELTAALTSIRSSIANCTFLTPSAPDDPNAIDVTIGGVTIARDPSRTNGWDWVDQSYGQLAFFGAACEAATNAVTNVQGVVSCGP
jgi:hypothetical protein